MRCYGVVIWSYWLFTLTLSLLYSSLTLSSIGIKWKCIDNPTKCINDDVVNYVTITGAIISSVVTTFHSINVFIALMNDRKRYQGYCIGSALHTSIILVWYAVSVNESTKKINNVIDVTKWTQNTIQKLFNSSYYLACILSGVQMLWVFIIVILVKQKRSISMNEV